MIILSPSHPPSEGDLQRTGDNHDFQRYLTAAAHTVDYLEQRGLDVTPAQDDLNTAAAMAIAYAKDPMSTAKKANTPQKISTLPPPAVREAHRILTAFGHNIVRDATQIRHMVTNKLIEESESPDPRVRLKALELLGKISDVGLFAEKSEVTVTHQTSDELRKKLKERLASVIDITPIEEMDAGGRVIDARVTGLNTLTGSVSDPDNIYSDPDSDQDPDDPYYIPEDGELDTSLWEDKE